MMHAQHKAREQVLSMRRITHQEVYDSYISRCHGPISAHLVGVQFAFNNVSSIVLKCFCLCASDFIECSCPDIKTCSKCRKECEPPKKKKRLSLVRKDVDNCSGLGCFQFVTKEAEEEGFISENILRVTQWALKVFSDWKAARIDAQEEACLNDLLKRANPADGEGVGTVADIPERSAQSCLLVFGRW